jgi:hypothetical protein
MYQALVRITKDDRIAADTPPESPRLDWAALLDSLLRRLRDAHDGAPHSGNNTAGEISRPGG